MMNELDQAEIQPALSYMDCGKLQGIRRVELTSHDVEAPLWSELIGEYNTKVKR